MTESKYLGKFQKVVELAHESFEFRGNLLLIEVIDIGEMKSKGGIIIAPSIQKQVIGLSADKPTFARVLLTGEGYYEEDEDGEIKTQSLETNPGDIVLIPSTSIKSLSVFGQIVSTGETQLGLALDSDIQMRFKGQAGFDKFFEVLNS